MFNKTPKVVLKARDYGEYGLNYSADYRADEGVCASMALSFAVSLFKENGMALTKFKSLATDMWKELEENENGEN